MFPYEFCEILKNTFFIEHLQTTASVATKECEGFTNLIQISPEVTSQSYSYCKNLFLLRCCDVSFWFAWYNSIIFKPKIKAAVRRCFSKKRCFENFAIFTGKHLCWVSF